MKPWSRSRVGNTAWLVATVIITLALAATMTQASSQPAVIPPEHADGPGAAAPFVLNYQGRLADPVSGNPKPDGTYQLTFALYDVASGGSPLWSEVRDIQVKGGLFNTRLGEVTPLPAIFDGRALWLGITVSGDPQATPRLQVTFVAYAAYATQAGTAGSASTADLATNATRLGGNLPDFYRDAGNIAAGVLAYDRFSAYGDLVNDGRIGAASGMVAAGNHEHKGTDIIDGSIGTVDLADGSVTSAKIADGNIANVDLAANAVDSAKIADLGIATADLANGSVTTAKIADGSITAAKLASGVVPKFFSINAFSAFITGGAVYSDGYGPYAGLQLPDSGSPAFSYSFVIPPDYTAGTNITVRFIWNTPATSCDIELRPNYISIARAGRTHIKGSGVTDGMSMVGGTVLTAPATANQSGAKDMLVYSPVSGTNLAGGDSIMFGLYRPASASTDTCANYLAIQGVSVSYQ